MQDIRYRIQSLDQKDGYPIAHSANEITSKGFEAASFSISNSGKAIILAKVADDTNAR